MEPSRDPYACQTAAERVEVSRRVTRVLTLAMATIGGLAFVLLLWHLGSNEVWIGLAALRAYAPLLCVLELGRLSCELLGTRALLRAADRRVPAPVFVRGQLLGQALDVVMPAGRAAAETAKATLFARYLGLPQAAAIATALQLAVLGANAAWALCGYLYSPNFELTPTLRIGLVFFTAVTSGVVLSVCVFAALPATRRLFARVRFVHASLERFADLLRTAPRALASALLAQFVGRGIQAMQLTVLVYALGVQPSFAHTAVMEAVYMVGAACGELVPAQLGTTDAAFVLAAPALGLTQSAAFSVSLALHAIQVAVGAVSFFGAMLLWWLEARATQNKPACTVLASHNL